MGVIKDFLSNISKDEAIKNILPLTIGVSTKYGSFDNEEDIMEKLLRSKERLTECSPIGYFMVNVYGSDSRTLMSFSMREFHSCCGKVILHNMMINHLYRCRNFYSPSSVIQLNSNSMLSLVQEMLKLVIIVCDIYGYTSIDFIVSDREQPYIFEAVKTLGIKEVSSFKNRRNNEKHTCYTYTIDIGNNEIFNIKVSKEGETLLAGVAH